ncbi:MAG: lipid-A-disaccharide synthase [Kangiella sp.]|jgi:lipid-A-disaccharide synthase|nr:lipid-A-disaccharide synthase [Kangiella sp.]MCW9027340.1 lipid-A-disaccharide synthase [Kangiella sp.]
MQTSPFADNTVAESVTKIAIIAGESSGDILGAGLIKELKKHFPNAEFEGIAGDLMQAEGCESLYPMESLAVMGIVPILKRLPELLKMRREIAKRWIESPPDMFIGIDAPEFNIGLEKQLKAKGIKTIHYVSPSVWAWRPKRIFKIRKATDLMLCLFPFEQGIYQRHAIDNFCVGHPLADQIPMEMDKLEARQRLGLSDVGAKRVICIMPGSRGSEMKFLGQDFIETAKLIQDFYPDTKFIAPMANQARRHQFETLLQETTDAPDIQLVDGQSRDCMAASDLLVMASGTATLEAMLIKRPTVVAYKVGGFSYQIFKRLLIIDTFAIPNLLAKKPLIPELIQDECTPDNIFAEVRAWLEDDGQRWQETKTVFDEWHSKLRKDADVYAANSITQWWLANTR